LSAPFHGWAISQRLKQVSIDILQGTAAVVRVELWKDGVLTFTDYLSLSEFSAGWRIGGEIYVAHPKS